MSTAADVSWTDARAGGWFIAVIVIGLGVAVAAFLPMTVDLRERIGEAGAVVTSLLFLTWVYRGGLDRFSEARENRRRANLIRSYPGLPGELDSILFRAWQIFGVNPGRREAFRNVANLCENAVFTSRPASPRPAEELDAGRRAQAVRTGWNAMSSVQQALFGEARRLLWGSATRNSSEFIAAFRLVREFMESNYAMVESYFYEMKQAKPTRYDENVGEEWGRFKDALNTLAALFEDFGTRAGNTVGAEGPYNLPRIVDLVIHSN